MDQKQQESKLPSASFIYYFSTKNWYITTSKAKCPKMSYCVPHVKKRKHKSQRNIETHARLAFNKKMVRKEPNRQEAVKWKQKAPPSKEALMCLQAIRLLAISSG